MPTSYGVALKAAANGVGSTNVVGTQNYSLFRYNSSASNPDAITSANSSSETNAQGVGGLVIKVSDFGTLPAGTQIYGYSLMGYDVNISNLNNLVDATGTAYPTNTDSGTGNGGIDLAAVNGLEIRELPVPEPGAAALCGLGGVVLLAGAWQRRATCSK